MHVQHHNEISRRCWFLWSCVAIAASFPMSTLKPSLTHADTHTLVSATGIIRTLAIGISHTGTYTRRVGTARILIDINLWLQ